MTIVSQVQDTLVEELVRHLSTSQPDEALLEVIRDRHLSSSSYDLGDVVLAFDKLDPSIKDEILFHAPLSSVPTLVPIIGSGSDVDSTAAQRLLVLIGDRGNARECMMVVQEQLERLGTGVEEGDDEEGVSQTSAVFELATLADVSARTIPRLVRRRLSPRAMLQPLLSSLKDVYAAVVHVTSNSAAPSLLKAMLRIVTACRDWIGSLDVAVSSAEEFEEELIQFGLLCLFHVLDAIDASIVERHFENLQPRYRIPGRPFTEQGWEDGQRIMDEVQVSMQLGPETLVQRLHACRPGDVDSFDSSLAVISLLVHCFQDQLPKHNISSLFLHTKPVILQSLHSGLAVKVILAWLWYLTDTALSEHSLFEEQDVLTVIQLLAPVSALSPQPSIRFTAFRLLATLLDVCNPAVQLSILRDFLAPECPFPQLRVAAVGLLKEKLMSAQSQDGSLFRTPLVLQVVGRLILRPQPENLFSTALSLTDFLESSEPARLVECLNLVYVWQNIDRGNRTGIADSMPELTQWVLEPLTAQLREWNGARGAKGLTALSGLVVALERFHITL